MRLKRFLLSSALALSFTASATSQAHADPVSAAVVAFVGFTGTAAAVATFVINTALYAAGSWAVGKAAKALGLMKGAVAERQATVTTLSLGETPREVVVGVACTGGSLINAWNHGGKYQTDYVTRRVALSDHVLDGLVGYYVDDTYYPFNANGVQPGFGNGALQLTFANATATGAMPPLYMLNAGVGLTSADRCPSVAEIWITYKYDDKVWTRGHPVLKFVVRGLRVYDARFDPQFGYSGPSPQTWDDVSSHRFSQNAAVVRYHLQRGVFAEGHHGELQHLLLGRGLSAAQAPAGRIIASANVCDEIVDGQPRYTVGGVISTAQSHIEVEEMFAAATAGQIVQRDGGVEVEPGQAKAAVVTITDQDLVAGKAVSFSEFTPDADGGRINTVIPRYVEPSQLFKDHSGAVLRDQDDIDEDGGPRELTLPLLLVTNKGQADRCGEIMRRAARLERRATVTLVPLLNAGRAAAELEDGDIIAWQSNRYHEGATVRYRVDVYGVDEGWCNTLQLREITASVFGQPDPIEDRAAPPPPPIPIDALQLLGVGAEAINLPGETSTLPAIRFTWDVVTDDTAMTAIRAEVRRVGETAAAPTRIDDVAKGQANVTNGVGPDQALECRLVPIGDPSRPVLPSNWITVSTSMIVAGGISDGEGGSTPASEILDRLLSAEVLSAANSAAVAALENEFEQVGDIAAMAAQAAADAASAAAAEAAAIIAKGGAETAASTASTKAGEASVSAGQAATSAANAAGSATTASNQATVATNAATAAGGSASAAGTSATNAASSATASGNSATASQAARVAAESARDAAAGSATAAATSASSASTSATNAGQSATAAQTAATTATTKAGEASTSATQASNSATTAAGSASNAATSATNAANSATAAGGSASAAAGSASTASTQATNAGNSAAAASASQVSASSSAAAAVNTLSSMLPSVFNSLDNWTGSGAPGGPVEALSSLSSSVATVVNDPDLGTCIEIVSAGGIRLSTKGYLSAAAKYELTLRAKVVAAGSSALTVRDNRLGADLAYLTAGTISLPTPTVGQVYNQTIVVDMVSRGASTAGTTYVRFGLSVFGTIRLALFQMRDVTAREDAAGSASAAATSASSASTSATSAGQFATAASGSATTASTAAGQAQTYSNQASSSAADAQSASVSAGVSASTALGAIRNGPILPSDFRMGLSEWTSDRTGAPDAVATVGGSVINNDAVFGTCWSSGNVFAAAGSNILTKGVTELTLGRVYEVRIRGRVFSSDGSVTLSPAFATLNQGYAQAGSSIYFSPNTVITGNSEFEIVGTISNAAGEGINNVWPSDARMIRCGLRLATAETGLVVRVKSIIVSDVTDRLSAAASSAAAVTQAASASASAAAASISASLAAQIGGGSLNQNPMSSAWAGTAAVGPDAWTRYNSANGTIQKGPGINGAPQSARTISSGTANFGLQGDPVVAPTGGEWLVMEASFTLVAGDLRGSGLTVQTRNGATQVGSNINLNFATETDTGGRTNGAGVVGRTYTYRKLIDARGTNVNAYWLYMMTRLSTFSPQGAVTLDWHRAAIRSATAEEVATGTVLPDVQAQLSVTAAVAADAQTRLSSARFEVIAAAGGNPAQLLIRADQTGSLAALVAQAISFSNVVGGTVVEVMRLISGDVYITGKLFMGLAKQITLDPTIPALIFTPTGGTAKMLYGAGFGTSSDCIMWFGPKATAVGDITRTNGSWAFGTDSKVYYGTAELGSGGGGGTGGAAYTRTSISGSFTGTGWTTVASVAFSGRPATGWWNAVVDFLSGYSDGTMNAQCEMRIIENGASVALATSGQFTIQAGGVISPIEGDTSFFPMPPWAQTRPAGNITLLLQIRQVFSTGSFTNISGGSFGVDYRPGA